MSSTTKSVTVFPDGGVTVIVHSAVRSSEFAFPVFATIFSVGSTGPLGLVTVTSVSLVEFPSPAVFLTTIDPPSGRLLISVSVILV